MGIRIHVTVLLCYIACICNSQHFTTRLFSKDQGLPDPYVYAIIQDTKGYLWIPTGKGLVRFDGQVFEKAGDVFSGQDAISASVGLKTGELLFGTFSGKLYLRGNENSSITLLKQHCSATINKLLASEYSDAVFINTTGNGIFIKRGNELQQIRNSPDHQVNAIAEWTEKLLLAGTPEGLLIVNSKTGLFERVEGLDEEIKNIQKLTLKQNVFVVSTASGKISEVLLEGNGTPKIKELSTLKRSDGKGIITFLYSEQDRNLYLATEEERLSILNTGTQRFTQLNEADFSAPVNSFFQDKEGNVWVSTMGKGLYRVLKTPYEQLETPGSVFAISQDKEGALYYGIKNGIQVYNAKGEFKKHITKIGSKDLGKINALYFDGQRLWIGTNERGLLVADPGSLREFTVEFSGITNISVNSISGQNENVLVTTNLDGVYNYSNYVLKDHFSVQNSLLHNNVYYALLSKSGKIYYATHNTSFNYSFGHQLYEIDPKTLGLISDYNGFAQDKDDKLYIATNGEGLYVMKDTTLRPFEFNEALNSKYCEGLLFDDVGNLWIVERYHLYKYFPKEKVIWEMKFKEKQTMFYPNSFYANNKGEVFFGTDRGVIRYTSSGEKARLAIPYLLSLTIQDSLLKTKEGRVFPNGLYHFVFEFSALALKNSEDLRFRYKLEGRDEHWSELSTSRKAEYSKLGEGEYSFKVIAYNSEGFSSEETELYHFRIEQPFWKKAGFWTLLAVAVIVLVTVIIRWRTAQLIKAKQELEKLVEEKTVQLRREKEVIQKNTIRIEEQNQEIKDSITYAKRIQDALLLDKELIRTNKENIFILYQPRDIVSGDFYWGAEMGALRFIAAADCTGHGVPGALMSMIGTTLLNKIVLERKVIAPKDILKELDKEIRQALKQHTEDATRDGMDMCLCCVDTANRKLIYAGAMRPLFFVRNRQLTEYSPTKNAIGGFSYNVEKEFSQAEIDLEKNDMFYLFSDGYADQFGGENGKKLMVKNFKKILVSISEMEPAKQEENLKRVYNNWKGDLDQVDDVLVIGVRI